MSIQNRFCPKCGTSITYYTHETQIFCTKCGANLPIVNGEITTLGTTGIPSETYQQPVNQVPFQQPASGQYFPGLGPQTYAQRPIPTRKGIGAIDSIQEAFRILMAFPGGFFFLALIFFVIDVVLTLLLRIPIHEFLLSLDPGTDAGLTAVFDIIVIAFHPLIFVSILLSGVLISLGIQLVKNIEEKKAPSLSEAFNELNERKRLFPLILGYFIREFLFIATFTIAILPNEYLVATNSRLRTMLESNDLLSTGDFTSEELTLLVPTMFLATAIFFVLLTITFFFLLRWSFFEQSIILENKDTLEGFRASFETTRGRWISIAALYILFGAIEILIGGIPYLIFGESLSLEIELIWISLTLGFMLPLRTIAFTVFYLQRDKVKPQSLLHKPLQQYGEEY